MKNIKKAYTLRELMLVIGGLFLLITIVFPCFYLVIRFLWAHVLG
jgi:hypothetical protein